MKPSSLAVAREGMFAHELLNLAGGVLEVDLSAITHNWKHLARMSPGTECAAVLSHDAWGLGLRAIGAALARAGCRTFFVATPLEGVRLREACPHALIHVLHGLDAGNAAVFERHSLRPVLNSCDELRVWAAHARRRHAPLPAALRVDTGGDQLGFSLEEARQVALRRGWREHVRITLLSSRLLHGENPCHPLNEAQKRRFGSLRRLFPDVRGSLLDTPAMLALPDWHCELFRAGLALLAPSGAGTAALRQPVRLRARIMHVRTLDVGQEVEGAGWSARRPSRLALVGIGANHGLGRMASGVGPTPRVRVAGLLAPVVGFSLSGHLCVDITDIDGERVGRGDEVEVFGPRAPVRGFARWLGVPAAQLLCALGGGLHRVYLPSSLPEAA